MYRVHSRLKSYLSCSCFVPPAIMKPSWFSSASLPATLPTICPSKMTSIRSERLMISSSSKDTSSTALFLFRCSTTVSYTHLDVYKRQAPSLTPGYMHIVPFVSSCIISVSYNTSDTGTSVSYTHLNFYGSFCIGSCKCF